MASRSSDFNYKVALASGLKSLQAGRLRQAEEQFRYLVQHFPGSDGGYRGLAKVLVEQEDRPAALRMLLDGGAALAKAGQRPATIALYREAVALEPADLASHRRLAAALTLAGETDEAAREYVRFIASALASQDTERAKLEAAYALERLPGNAEIAEIARGAGAPVPAAVGAAPDTMTAPAAMSADERDTLMRSAFGAPSPAPHAWETPSTESLTSSGPAASGAWQAPAPSGETWGAQSASSGETWSAEPAPAPSAAAASAAPEAEPIAADADALVVEATAARYLAKRDPRGGEHALEAARRYIADGRVNAASDLLLQLIAAGISGHDAQRLLVDVTTSLGKNDVAKMKVKLLVAALKLDGRVELAAEVEQLAQAT